MESVNFLICSVYLLIVSLHEKTTVDYFYFFPES